MNLILERSDRVSFYTDMQEVLRASGLLASEFDWYISDVETNRHIEGFPNDDRWVSGIELENFLSANSVQFMWAVFSAFPMGYRCEVVEAPYADGNPRYWQGVEVSPQLHDALFEIVCWDSSATILIGLPNTAEHHFLTTYPETQSLAEAS